MSDKTIERDIAAVFQQRSIAKSIRQQKAHAKEQQYMASHDALTGLPNRMLLMDRLQQAIKQAKRLQHTTGLICINIEGLTMINDQYGHDAGDTLLRNIAQRLQCCVRESDTVARVAGDEFIIVVNHMHHVDDAYAVAQKVLISIYTPLMLAGKSIRINSSIRISSSIGISHYPDGDADLLLKKAYQAMRQAKQNGHNRIVLFKQQAG